MNESSAGGSDSAPSLQRIADDCGSAANAAADGELVAALVSPPGAGGMAVIQVCGPNSIQIVAQFLRRRGGAKSTTPAADDLKLFRWVDGSEHLDDVIVVHSLHGGRVPTVCITTHGSVRVVERILMCLERAGVRISEEMPMWAAWEGLSPIESAVMDHLPLAKTRRVAEWLVDQIVHLRASIEEVVRLLHDGRRATAIEHLERLRSSYETGRMLLDGAHVAVVGPPNAGKSTLANRLFDRPRSLESDEAGTTRDWVGRAISIDGIPLTLSDTAGLREPADPMELQALRQAEPIIRSADVQLLVLDASRPLGSSSSRWFDNLLEHRKLLVVLNKSDLAVRPEVLLDASKFCSLAPVPVSALNGTGLDALGEAIISALFSGGDPTPMSCIWDKRQLRSVQDAGELAVEDCLGSAMLLSRTFLGSASKK